MPRMSGPLMMSSGAASLSFVFRSSMRPSRLPSTI